jgi:quercetin dioxygenase-like cupin family protein
MKHVHYDEVPANDVDMEGARGVRMRMLVGEDDGAPNFFMRRFEVKPGGETPRHTHAWEHETYILEGEGIAFCEGEERPIRPGDVVYVAPEEKHQFIASPDAPLAFLCLVPKK